MNDDNEFEPEVDGTVTVVLEHPFDHGGEPLAQVRLRRATVADLQHMDTVKGDVAKTVSLIARLSGLTPAAVKRMDAADLVGVSRALDGLLGNR